MSIAEKLNTIAENMAKIQNVTKKWFDRGRNYEQQEFWDVFQQNGTRENYENGFAGKGWYKENLTPKYDITPSFASNIFLNCPYEGDLRDLPVKLDFSKSQSISNMFGYFYGLTGVGVINTTSSPTCTAVFINARALITIEKFILKADGSQTFSNCFTQCYKLQNIVIDGVIGQDISFQHSTELSKDSITSIINALKVDANGKTLTLSKTAKNKAFTADEWNTRVATKSNWTISLV